MKDHINKPVDPAGLYGVLKRLIPEKHPGTPSGQPEPVLLKTGTPLDLPPLPGIDPVEALKRLNNNATLFVKMLNDFRHDYVAYPTVLKQLVQEGAWLDVQTRAHTVKGISGYMGARRLFQTASDLEAVLKRGGTTHGKDLIQPFVDALDEVLTSLAALCLNVPGAGDEQAVSTTATLDMDDVVGRLERLIDHLHQGEYVAGELFSEIEEILKGHGHDDVLAGIGALIDDIEYSDAADVAGKLKETLYSQDRGRSS
jgi:HPt (histidine-containing phosphotransfer) domain-containing protein